MEKSTDRELWVVYNRGKSATWFATDDRHTARQKAEVFLRTEAGSIGMKDASGKIIPARIVEGAKTAEQALASYNSIGG